MSESSVPSLRSKVRELKKTAILLLTKVRSDNGRAVDAAWIKYARKEAPWKVHEWLLNTVWELKAQFHGHGDEGVLLERFSNRIFEAWQEVIRGHTHSGKSVAGVVEPLKELLKIGKGRQVLVGGIGQGRKPQFDAKAENRLYEDFKASDNRYVRSFALARGLDHAAVEATFKRCRARRSRQSR